MTEIVSLAQHYLNYGMMLADDMRDLLNAETVSKGTRARLQDHNELLYELLAKAQEELDAIERRTYLEVKGA